MKLQLKPGTTLDTTGVDVDQGYTAELMIDLTKIGYPSGRGDGVLFFTVNLYDGDSFTPFTDSYGTRTWWGAEYDNTCCPPWSYMDPLENVLTGVPETNPGGNGYVLLSAAPNPFRSATKLRYRLPTASIVQLDVFDPQGRIVHSRALGVQPAGEQSAGVFGFQGKTGVYLYRLRMSDPNSGAERAALSGRMLVVR